MATSRCNRVIAKIGEILVVGHQSVEAREGTCYAYDDDDDYDDDVMMMITIMVIKTMFDDKIVIPMIMMMSNLNIVARC